MGAWYHTSLRSLTEPDFDDEQVVGALAAAATDAGLPGTQESMSSWRRTLELLHQLAETVLPEIPSASTWECFLEAQIPMRGRRIDLALIAEDILFIVECKTGDQPVTSEARWQAEQYALDLRDFHEPSHGLPIVPVLVAYRSQAGGTLSTSPERSVQPVIATNERLFASAVQATWNALHDGSHLPIDAEAWINGSYKPTPTIIEAAQSLYAQHDVKDIALAGSVNLDRTVASVLRFIERCRIEKQRGIVFITGSPGAGKTLAGLEIAHAADVIADGEGLGLFLSGNWPLVEVIGAAIAQSAAASGRRERRNANREVTTLIGHAYRFRNEYAGHSERVPHHRIVLFDEAQRAWDETQVARKERTETALSEPAILLDIMSRLPEWSVVVAMVGSGQEINTGEAGLTEWGRAIAASPHRWQVIASPRVLQADVPANARLFPVGQDFEIPLTPDPDLHLQMNVRSPRAERLNHWVDSLLVHDLSSARAALPNLSEYPMALTRDLNRAKQWLREHADAEANQRMGLLASAGAKRLRAWGLEVNTLRNEQNWPHWFLRERDDIRSSNQLEVPATNFDCQGLEIDWSGICWGNDFVPTPSGEWQTRSFSGTRWSMIRKDPHFLVNSYRVILTRARRGQIIWVPQPHDASDTTLDPRDFDAIAEVLQAAGVPSID